jgi:integrase
MNGPVIGQTTVIDVLGTCSDANPVEIYPEGAVRNAGVMVDTVNFHIVRTGRRFFGFTTDGTKSGKPRKVPLSPTLVAALKAHRHMRGPLVFCQDDGSPLTLWHLHGALERATRRASLRLLRWHDLRHSFASNLTIGGTPMRQVQEWMGHATILMTMRYSLRAEGVSTSRRSKLRRFTRSQRACEPSCERLAGR